MTFDPYFIRDTKYYNRLIWKLRMILSDSPYLDEFKYSSVKYLTERYPQKEQIGILVEGLDSMGIKKFQKFFSVKDIHFHFDQLNRRLDLS